MDKELEEAIEELEDSYELHQCEWAKRCLETIRNYIENSIPKEVVKEKIKYVKEEGYWEFTTDRDADKCVDILQELLEK